ncbi:hypothetical protein Tco_0045063 [Tanacetum coccineum]
MLTCRRTSQVRSHHQNSGEAGTFATYRTKPALASKSQKTPSKNKESTHLRRSRRLEDRSMTKEKVRKERSKFRRKRFGRQEASSNSEYEEGSEDAYEDLNSPYKRPKPAPFTQRITRFKYHRRAKLPWNIRVYEGNEDPEDHLGIFSATAEQEEWPMLVCVDSFEELSQKFLEEFSQQKRYAKDPTEIHGIKRRQNEGLQAFMDQSKFESSHIKGVPPVLRISAFMHGHEQPSGMGTWKRQQCENHKHEREDWGGGGKGNRKRPFKEESGQMNENHLPASHRVNDKKTHHI